MAGQDYKRTIPAGGSTRINANGETYLFCKFTDRDITVDIAGRKVVMRAGSYMEFAPLRGENSQITIYNEDTDNPVSIILTLGVGTYDEKIVRGEITVLPGVRKASGQWVDDTRWDLKAAVTFTDWEPVSFTKKQILSTVYSAGNAVRSFGVFPSENAIVYQDSFVVTRRKDLITGADTVLQGAGQDYDFGNYVARCLTTTIDSDGRAWIGGWRKSDGASAFICVDSNLQVLAVEDAPDTMVRSTGVAGARIEHEGRLFYYIIKAGTTNVNNGTQNGIAVYEKIGNQFVLKLELPDQFYGYGTGTIQNGLLVVGYRPAGFDVFYGFYDLNTWESVAVNESEFFGHGSGGFTVTIDRANRQVWQFGGSDFFEAKALISWTQTGKGVFTTCASGFMFKPEQRRTDAGIVDSDDGAGRVIVRGQIIRAMLDLYLGGFVADDYLDHVYAVTFDNEGGRAPRTITAGNTTFAGAKIEDNFTAIFPQSVTITLDNGLTIKG